MGLYVMLSTLTQDGSETLHKNPDRLKAVDEGDRSARLQGGVAIRAARRMGLHDRDRGARQLDHRGQVRLLRFVQLGALRDQGRGTPAQN